MRRLMLASFVTLACYDWRLLPVSIAAYHDAADEVLVGLDRDRRTWSGTPFELDRAALEAALAHFPKVRIIEERFSLGGIPIENDCREREHLARCARNDWVVEVDADELVEGEEIVRALPLVPTGWQLFGVWTTVVKVIGQTALVVDTTHGGQACALATRSRARSWARQTGESPFMVRGLKVEHLQMARPLEELAQKLAGWGHSDRVPADYLSRLAALDLDNFTSARNIGPVRPADWPRLRAVPLSSLRWGAQLGAS